MSKIKLVIESICPKDKIFCAYTFNEINKQLKYAEEQNEILSLKIQDLENEIKNLNGRSK